MEALNSEMELEHEAFADENYVTKLIEKYEAESKGENQQSPTQTESSINKGTGRKAGNEKTQIKNETPQEPIKADELIPTESEGNSKGEPTPAGSTAETGEGGEFH